MLFENEALKSQRVIKLNMSGSEPGIAPAHKKSRLMVLPETVTELKGMTMWRMLLMRWLKMELS